MNPVFPGGWTFYESEILSLVITKAIFSPKKLSPKGSYSSNLDSDICISLILGE